MTVVDDKIAFAEKHIRNKEGVPWRLKGREWVRDQFWRPADGWKLWRFDDSEPCETCAARIGEILDHPDDNPTTKCKCGGLTAEPILVTILNLDRGDGKTFNMMAYSLATLFTARNKSMSGMWASEDQGTRIFNENWKTAIEQSPALRHPKRSRIHGSPPVLDSLATNSRLEVLATAHKTSGGGRRTHLFYDEARDIPGRVVMALMPATNAVGGVECTMGHVQLTPEDIEHLDGEIPATCSACGRRLVEWWPRIIIASASGMIGGNDTDWLYELVEFLQGNPHKNYHLFCSSQWGKSLNPRKSEKVTNAVTEVFGVLSSMRDYVDAEYGNRWSRKGEDIEMGPQDVKRVMTLRGNEEGTHARAIGFLDTSDTVEKTSLVILAEEERSEFPWQYIYLSYLKFWWPGHGECSAWRRIDEIDVQREIELVLPMYPGLVKLAIDPKLGGRKRPGEAWPVLMMRALRTGGSESWRKKLEAYKGSDGDTDIGWDLLIARVLDRTIQLQECPEIIQEVKGLTLARRRDSRPKVEDRNRKVMHKDITQALACACWLIKKDQLRSRRQHVTLEDVKRRLGGTAPRVRTTNKLRGCEFGDDT